MNHSRLTNINTEKGSSRFLSMLSRCCSGLIPILFLFTFLLSSSAIMAQPANDLCSSATPISGTGTIAGTLIDATDAGDGTCHDPSFGSGPGDRGVWYVLPAGTSGPVTISTCGSPTDTELMVQTGACGALTCVLANDDACGLQSSVSFIADPSELYSIQVDTWFTGGNPGDFILNFDIPGGCSDPIGCTPVATSIDVDLGCAFGDGFVPDLTGLADFDYGCNTPDALVQDPLPGTLISSLPGYPFSDGDDIVVTVTATSAEGATADCTVTVTLNDTNAPQIDCIAHQVQVIDSDCGSATVPDFRLDAFISLGCSGLTFEDIMQVPAPGDPIPVAILDGATYTVNVNIAYGLGQATSCPDFTVTMDITAPFSVSGCPSDQAVGTDDGLCTAVVTWDEPLVTLACGNPVTVKSSHSSGDAFPIGNTQVTYSFHDDDGNVDFCYFTIIVTDDEAPEITCLGDLAANNDLGLCGAVVEFDMPLATDNCGLIETTFLETTFADDIEENGNMFDIENIGSSPLTIDMFDIHFDASSSIGDNETVNVYYVSGGGTYFGNQNNSAAWTLLGTATATNAGPGLPSSVAVGGLTILPGELYGIYITFVGGQSGPFMAYTVGSNVYSDANLSIQAGIGNEYPFGDTYSPRTWNGRIHYTTAGNANAIVNQTAGILSGGLFPVGTTTNTFVAHDAAGNTSTCSFDVVVTDTEAPTALNCPSTQELSFNIDCDNGNTPTLPDLTGFPQFQDNCGIVSIAQLPIPGTDLTDLTYAGGVYEDGATTVVSVTATDAAGLSFTCDITVELNDDIGPFIACPADFLAYSETDGDGACGFVIPDYTGLASAGVLCGTDAATVTQSPPALTVIPNANGVSTVITLIATDGAGNSSACEFSVEFCDNTAPTISADIAGFVGDFAPSEWTETEAGNGSINITPSTLTVIGNNTGSTLTNQATASCPVSGSYGFSWDYITTDVDGPSFDPAYYINGTLIQLTDNGGADNQSGSILLNCIAGDEIGFAITNFVGALGGATLTVTDFTVVGNSDCESPEPVELLPGECLASITLTPPNAIDNCYDDLTIYGERSDGGDDLTADNGYTGNFAPCESTVTWYAEDGKGNVSEALCIVTVTVTEPIHPQNQPQALCVGSILLGINDTGTVELCAGDIDNGSSDNCLNGPLTYQIHKSDADGNTLPGEPIQDCVSYDCSDLETGPHYVCLIVTDCSGNSSACITEVDLEEKHDPYIACPADIVIECDVDNDGSPLPLAIGDPNPSHLPDYPRANTAASSAATPSPDDDFDAYLAWVAAGYGIGDPSPGQDVATGITGLPIVYDNCGADITYTDEYFYYDGATRVGPVSYISDLPINDPHECEHHNYEIERTWLVVDDYGRTAECTQLIIVQDTTDPVIDPEDVVDATIACDDAGALAALLAQTPSATDNCYLATFDLIQDNSGAPELITTPQHGGVCVRERITREWLATDACGNTANLIQTIDLTDTEAPELTVTVDGQDPLVGPGPHNITVTNGTDLGLCNALVHFTAESTDNCSDIIIDAYTFLEDGDDIIDGLLNVTFTNGTVDFDRVLQKGVTTFYIGVLDDCANLSYVEVNVTVQDDEDPYFIDCTETGVLTFLTSTDDAPLPDGPNNCRARVELDIPAINDNCPGGYMEMMLTAETGAVIVGPFLPYLNTWLLVDQPDNQIAGGLNVGSYTFSFRITDAVGNTSETCLYEVEVVDDENPTVECPVQAPIPFIGTLEAATVYVSVSDDGTEDCTASFTDGLYGGDYGLLTNIVPTVDDYCGYTATWTLTGAGAADPADNTGTFVYVPGHPAYPFFGTSKKATDMTFDLNLGNTSVQIVATDAAGNSAQCSFSVTVYDDIDPTIDCPEDIVANTDPGVCTYNANVLPTVDDNCGVHRVEYVMSGATAASGTILAADLATSELADFAFNVGVTTVTYTVFDIQLLNSATCSYTVTISDMEDPIIACPAYTYLLGTSGTIYTDGFTNASIPLESLTSSMIEPLGDCETDIEGLEITTTDNCCVSSIQYRVIDRSDESVYQDWIAVPNEVEPADADLTLNLEDLIFLKGEWRVELRAWDCHMNEGLCDFDVDVFDDEKPAFGTCPGDKTAYTVATSCQQTVTWNRPQDDEVWDNCLAECGVDAIQGPFFDYDGGENIDDLDIGIVLEPVSDNTESAEFPVGIRYVKYYVDDEHGNREWCIFQVEVIDHIAPWVIEVNGEGVCPSNDPLAIDITINFDLDCEEEAEPFANYAQTLNIFSDNCPNLGVTQSIAPGTPLLDVFGGSFEDGETVSLTLTATDLGGNTATCTFLIQLNDNTSPSIICPGDQILGSSEAADLNCDFTLPSYIDDADVSFNCGSEFATVTQDPEAGTVFPDALAGIDPGTTVTLTATDAADNTFECSFFVSFVDDEAPQLTEATVCTAPLPVELPESTLDQDFCTASIQLETPTGVAEDCGGITFIGLRDDDGAPLTAENEYTGLFSPCITTVTWYAIDDEGNESEALCSVEVIVTEPDSEFNQPFANCNDGITSGLTDAGIATVCVDQVNNSSFDDCGDVTILIAKADENGPIEGEPELECLTYTCDDLGLQWVCLKVTDCSGNVNFCTTQVLIEDKKAPRIVCPADITIECDVDNNGDPLAYEGSLPPHALNYPAANVPTDISLYNAWLNNPFLTTQGQNAEDGITGLPLAMDNCGAIVTYVNNYFYWDAEGDRVEGDYDQLPMNDPHECARHHYDIERVWTVTDGEGYTAECTQLIQVRDTEAPVITWPAADADQLFIELECSDAAGIAYALSIEPTATDNCYLSAMDLVADNSGSPEDFGCIEQIERIWLATDACGNTSYLQQTIFLNDYTDPTLTVEAGGNTYGINDLNLLEVDTDAGLCSALVAFTLDADDNCDEDLYDDFILYIDGIQTDYVFLNGTNTFEVVLPKGESIVDVYVADDCSNSANVVIEVTVMDNEAPAFADCTEDTYTWFTSDNSVADPDAGGADCISDDILLSITVDDWSQETSWELRNLANDLIASDAYDSSLETGTTIEETFAGLAEDTYFFTIFDSANDGICCGFGLGSYSLSSGGDVIFAGGEFESSETTEFCVGAGSLDPDGCGTVVSVEVPPFQDNCPLVMGDMQGSVEMMLTVDPSATSGAGASFDDYNGQWGDVTSDAGGSIAGSLPVGSHTIEFQMTDASGNTSTICEYIYDVLDDEDPILDCPSSQVVYLSQDAAESGCVSGDILLSITTDQWGSETTWELTNSNDDPIASGGTYVGFSTFEETFSGLADDTYTFTIFDSFGDGICCAYGSGSYSLSSDEGVIFTGGAFGDEESTSFCIGDAVAADCVYTFVDGETGSASIVPELSDNCDYDFNATLSGATEGSYDDLNFALEVGATSIVYTATDNAGNVSQCSFVVTVVDDVNPELGCPSFPDVLYAETGVCYITLDLDPTSISDNCTGGYLSYILSGATAASGEIDVDEFPGALDAVQVNVGTTYGNYTLYDAEGNPQLESCTFTIVVEDDQDPIVSCPTTAVVGTSGILYADVAAAMAASEDYAAGDCESTVSDLMFSATDNCCISSVQYRIKDNGSDEFLTGWIVQANEPLPADGDMSLDLSTISFEKGEYTIYFRSWDCYMNEGLCQTTVTVVDDEKPAFTDCPGDQVVEPNLNSCEKQVIWTTPAQANVLDNCLEECGLQAISEAILSTDDTESTTSGLITDIPVVPGLVSSAIFPIGTHYVKYYVDDAAGNREWCIFEIEVEDNQAPQLVTCPTENYVINMDLNCNDELTLGVYTGEPLFLDPCGYTLSQAISEGDAFEDGDAVVDAQLISIDVTATDASGNSTVCTMTLEINDSSTPNIDCPGSTTLNESEYPGIIDDETCMFIVPDLTGLGIASPSCDGGSVTITQDPLAGTAMPIPANPFIMTLTATDDNSGETNFCAFFVGYNDDVAPALEACAPTSASATLNDPDVCDAAISLALLAPSASDCSGVTVYGLMDDADETRLDGPAYTADFPVCTTVVTWYAEDGAGNVSEFTGCNTTVTVTEENSEDFEPQAVCTEGMTLNLGNNGVTVPLTAEHFGQDSYDNCPESDLTYQIHLWDVALSEPASTPGPTISFDCGDVGQVPVCLIVTDCSGNSSACWTYVTVQDKDDPAVVCPADITIACHVDNVGVPATGTAWNVITPYVQADIDAYNTATGQNAEAGITGFGQGWDNCGGTVTYSDVSTQGTDPTDCSYYSYTVTRTWSIEDLHGNFGEDCDQIITVVDETDPYFVEGETDLDRAINCEDPNYDAKMNLALALVPTEMDLCYVTLSGPTTEIVEHDGCVVDRTGNADVFEQHIRTWIASDACGNTAIYTQVISIQDDTAPAIACPLNGVPTTFYTNNGLSPDECNADVSLFAFVVDCQEATLTYTVNDINNGMIVVYSGGGNEFQASNVPPGEYCIHFYAEDPCGNISDCIYFFSVQDNTDPMLDCSGVESIAVGSDEGICGAEVTFDHPILSDNCSGAELYVDYGLGAGVELATGTSATQTFPVGTTTVYYAATDSDGEFVLGLGCSLDVTVTDTESPVYENCPEEDIVLMTGDDGFVFYLCGMTDSWKSPLVGDNCEVVSYTMQIGDDAPVATYGDESHELLFPVGTTTIEYVATDAEGNTAICSVDVTVTDDEEPVTLCNDATIEIDENGVAILDPALIGGQSYDNCVLNLAVSQGSFDCSELGDHTVTLTASDDSGNSFWCTSTVTVEDNLAPVLSGCDEAYTADAADGTCEYLVSGTDWDVTATDNCSATLTNDFTGTASLDGAALPTGETTVTWTAVDTSGNTAQCSTTVTIGNPDLEAACQSYINTNTLMLGADGTLTLSAEDFDGGSGSACDDLTFLISEDNGQNFYSELSFDCGDITLGTPINIVLEAIDNNTGDSDQCIAQLSITDGPILVEDCPSDVTMDANVDECGALVTLTLPEAEGSCPVYAYSINGGGFIGTDSDVEAFFEIGTYDFQWAITNASGDDAIVSGTAGNICSLTITINANGAILGCTDPSAQNYNPSATCDDGSCILPAACLTADELPYAEDFEEGLGLWYQEVVEDDFDWNVNSGPTESEETGPEGASSGDMYLYIESSYPNFPAKKATINSSCLDLLEVEESNAQFAYNMNGEDVGTLELMVTVDGAEWETVWSQEGDQGPDWHAVEVDLSAYEDEMITLRFEGETTDNYYGDMAIDQFGLVIPDPAPECTGDITGDAVVNIDDFIAFNSAFGNVCEDCPEDLNGDGVVDTQDFLILNSAYGTDCTSGPAGVALLTANDLAEEVLENQEIVVHEELLKIITDMVALDFTIYPNPNEGNGVNLFIEEAAEVVTITVKDIAGRTLSIESLNGTTKGMTHYIDFTQKLSGGVYTVELNQDGKVNAKRFVVE